MKKHERKNRTSRLRKIELTVWIVFILIIGTISGFAIQRYHDSFESHNIYMPDIDGLIVGSPVYIMGTPIGHVIRIKIIRDDEIKVKFKVTNRSVHIPQGTIATVEFYGLGGSKSLVLYPPDSNREIPPELLTSNSEYIMVERPRRLRDTYVLLFEMYNTLMNMIYTVSAFGNEVKKIDLPADLSGKGTDLTEFTSFYDNWLDSSLVNLKNIRTIIDNRGKNIKPTD